MFVVLFEDFEELTKNHTMHHIFEAFWSDSGNTVCSTHEYSSKYSKNINSCVNLFLNGIIFCEMFCIANKTFSKIIKQNMDKKDTTISTRILYSPGMV